MDIINPNKNLCPDTAFYAFLVVFSFTLSIFVFNLLSHLITWIRLIVDRYPTSLHILLLDQHVNLHFIGDYDSSLSASNRLGYASYMLSTMALPPSFVLMIGLEASTQIFMARNRFSIIQSF